MTTFVQPSNRSTGDVITASIWNTDIVTNLTALAETELVWVMDGGGAAYATGVHRPIRVRFPATITKVWMLHDQSATATIKLHDTGGWSSYTASPSNDISNGGLGSSAAIKAEDETLTGYTTDVPADAILFPEVMANDNATWTVFGVDINYG